MTKRLISCLLCLCTLIGFAAVAHADDPVEVVFWNGYTGSDQPTLEAIVETYNNSQDKVHIKMEIMPWDTLYQKLMPAFIAGNAPDLIGFSVTRYMEYAMAGKLEPLDEELRKTGDWGRGHQQADAQKGTDVPCLRGTEGRGIAQNLSGIAYHRGT